MVSSITKQFPLGPNGPSNTSGENSGDGEFNRRVLEQLTDAVIRSSDSALGITILSNQPPHLQDQYVELLFNTWDSKGKMNECPEIKLDKEFAMYRFLNEVATSTSSFFSRDARDNAQYFLGSEGLDSIRKLIDLEESRILESEPTGSFHLYKGMAFSKMSECPIKRIREAYLKIKSDRDFLNTVNQTLDVKSLTKLISYGKTQHMEPGSYIVASLIYLCETSKRTEADKLFEIVLAYADFKEPLTEMQEKIWARPKAFFLSSVLKDMMNIICYSSTDLKQTISSKLSFSTIPTNVKSLLNNTHQLDYGVLIVKSIEAILLEEEFKELDNDLNSYFMLPLGLIYELRVESKIGKSTSVKDLVDKAIDRRCSNLDLGYKNKIVSLLERDLNFTLAA